MLLKPTRSYAMAEQFLTNAELCNLLRCSMTTMWRMRREMPGFPQPRRLGRRLLWTTEQVAEILALTR